MKVPYPIEYLLRPKFCFIPGPDLGAVFIGTDRLLRKAGEAERRDLQAYKAELQAKSGEEI